MEGLWRRLPHAPWCRWPPTTRKTTCRPSSGKSTRRCRPAHVLVVDDNSPDGTGRLADELAAADPRMHVLHRPGKLGLGTAILAGMRYAMEHDFDYFVSMDADFSHQPRYLPAMVAGMARHDVMIGSRYVPGGGTENWPLKRRLMSNGVNLLMRLLMRVRARDASGGFRCYRVSQTARGPPGTDDFARLLVSGGDAVPLPQGRLPRSARRRSSSPTAAAALSKVNIARGRAVDGRVVVPGVAGVFRAGLRAQWKSAPGRSRLVPPSGLLPSRRQPFDAPSRWQRRR